MSATNPSQSPLRVARYACLRGIPLDSRPAVAGSALMVLKYPDLVAVGIQDERGRDRPLFEPLRGRDGRAAGVDRSLVELRAVLGVEAGLPERIAVIDRAALRVLPSEPETIAVGAGDLDPVRELEFKHLFVEFGRSRGIAVVDAEIVDTCLHFLTQPFFIHRAFARRRMVLPRASFVETLL